VLLLNIFILAAMFALGCFGLWRAKSLFRKKSNDFLKANYGVVDPARFAPASNATAYIFIILGLWYCIAPVLVLAWNIPINAWAGLFIIGSGFHYIGQRFIRRKYGSINSK
jgi:hypothetical protein